MRIGITGSPGSGKKSVSAALAKLTGLQVVSINEIAVKLNLGKWNKNEFEVNVSKLRGKIKTDGKIVHGHLLPYVVPSRDVDFVAILRCSPRVLKKRYTLRKYEEQKVQENVLVELLDIISLKALEVYGKRKVSEIDTTRTKNPNTIALKIVKTLEGEIPKQFGFINWARDASRSPQDLKRMVSFQD